MIPSGIKQRFFDSLKRGTGEAYLLLLEYPKIDFSDLIIKGCLKNHAYDAQCEGSRADYLYRLIKKAKQKDKIVKHLLKKLCFQKGDFYDLEQMFDLAVAFHKAGYAGAKEAVYTRYEKNDLAEYDFCGSDALTELYGMEGILKGAELIGKILLLNPEDRESSWRIDEFQKRNKQLAVYKELEQAATENEAIKAYYNSILENKWVVSKRSQKVKRFTYELVKEKMEKGRFLFLSSSRNRELTPPELEKLANEFLALKDPQQQELYLRFFSSVKFPFDYKPIFKIAAGRNPKNTRLVEYAIEALKHFQSDEIRSLALSKIKNLKNPEQYLCLLVNNYLPGDAELLCEVINRSSNPDFIHSLVFGIIRIYQQNQTAECKAPLELMYNKMNCGLHRSDIVALLINAKVLSDKIFTELQFDSYEEVRKLYRMEKKRGR